MANLGILDQNNSISHISSSSSYTPKKKKKKDEEKVTITTSNNNKETKDIRTIKTEDTKDKSIVDKAKTVGKGFLSGFASGATGLVDAPLQKAQVETSKGSKVNTNEEALKFLGKTVLDMINPVPDMTNTQREIAKIRKDKSKKGLEKAVDIALASVGGTASQFSGDQLLRQAMQYYGALDKNASKKIGNVQKVVDKPSQDFQQNVMQEAQQIGGLTNTLTNVSQQIGNMGPSIATTALTKDPSAGLAIMGLSAKGQATNEALQNGANLETADRIGTAKGLTEVGTELLTGGLNIFGKGALDDIATNFINKKVGKAGLNFLAKQGLGLAGEMGEEIVSDLIGTLIDRGTIDPNANYTPQDLWNTISSTALTTLFLNGLTGGYTPNAYRQNALELQEYQRGLNENNNNINDNNISNTNQIREIIEQKENGQIDVEEANNRIAEVQNGTYEQNRVAERTLQQAKDQFNEVNRAEATGQIDSETANLERQALTNTVNQMTQQEEVQEEKKTSPVDLLSNKEKQILNKIYEKQANKQPLSKNDRDTLERFRRRQRNNAEIEQRKEQGLKNPELKVPNSYNDVKDDYGKYYSNADMSKFNSKIADKAAKAIQGNRYGRTKQQWYDLAKNIGMQADNMDSESLKRYAFASYKYFTPNKSINRQGNKNNNAQIHEWVKAVYEGARVGQKVETKTQQVKQEVKQEIKQEPKQIETKQEVQRQLKPTNTEDKIQNFRNSVENENIKDKDGFYKAVEKIIKDKDYNVILDSSITNEKGQSVNALITNDNGVTIKINPKSERAGEILLMHEVTHGIETKEMRKLILDYAKKNPEFNNALENLKEIYGTEDVTPEVVADISGQLLGNQEFINSLSVEKPTLFKKILDALTSLKNKLTGNSKYENFVKDLEVKYREAYRKANQDTANQNLKYTTKFSKNAEVTDNEGRKLTKDQLDYYDGTKVVDNEGHLITVYHTTTNPVIQFNEFNPVGTPGYNKGFGKQIVNFFTNSKFMSGSYANQQYEMAETKKLNNIQEAQEWLDNLGIGDITIEGTEVYEDGIEPILKYKTEEELLRNINSDIQREYGNEVPIQYEGYLKIENPYVVEVGGKKWNEISKTIIDKIPETIDKVEKYKKELGKLVEESKHKNEIYSSKAKIQRKSIDKIFNATTNEGIDFLYEYGLLEEASSYSEMYEAASKVGLELPPPNTKISEILNDKTLSNIEENGNQYEKKIINSTLEEFINDSKQIFQDGKDYYSESSWFEKNYKNVIKEDINTNYLSLDDLYELAENDFDELSKDRIMSGEMETNHVVSFIIRENNTLDSKYDGVIFKNVMDYVGNEYYNDGSPPADVYVTFNSNQFKSWDNEHPTSDPDIRYSKDGKKWQEFLDKYFKERGTTTKLNDNKEITATGPNNQEVKLKEKNGVYTRQDVVNEVKNIENQFKNQTLKAKNGEKVSNFYSNLTEKSKFIEPETRETLKSERSIKFYKSVTNEQALQEAVDIIGTTPASQARALNNFLTKQDQFTATDMAEGWVFLKQYQDVGNYDAMASVAKKMREMGTKSGQAIQMLGLEARLTPEGMYRFAVNELAQAEEKYNKEKGRTRKDIEQHRKNFQLTPEETEFIKSQMEKVQGMEEGRARDIEVAKINKMLTDKLPHTKGQSLKAWMRLSMLFNPKTQVRNIAGNALITPVNALSDVASGAVDRMVAKKTGARTIGGPSLGGLVSYVKGGVKGVGEAWQDYRMGIDTRNVNQDRFDIGQGKQFNEQHRGPLKGVRNKIAKLGNKTNDLLAFVMDAGDRFFYQGSLENSLYNQQKLNKTKEITKDMYDLAENEGLQRTWNDNNQFTKAVLNIRKAINDIGGLMHVKVGDYGLGDLMIPFAKTPANLTKAIVDYSPAGFLTSITEGRNLKRAIETGNYTLQQQHDFSQAVGKATAGTLLYALGIALAKAKITTGDSDEDKDLKNFMRYNLGIQPYSIKIGNKSFTYDWAQPVAAPFAITADIEKGVNDEMTPAQAIQQFLTTGFNILTEQSFLSGINEVLNDNDGLLHGIEQQIINMPATAVPTLLKQFTDMIDATKRQTYSKEGMTENSKKYAQSKLPTESKKLAPQVDVLGNEILKYGGENNAFNVFLNPSNTEKGKSNEVSKEIYALYEATGDKNIIPKKVDYTITKDGKKKVLTTQEMEKWQKASGRYVTDNVRKAMNTPKYQRMSDVDKATVINKIVNYSYMKAKSEIFDLPVSSYYSPIAKAESKGIPMYDYYISKIKEDKK